MADAGPLSGRRALVTGADQGIGRVIARGLVGQGAEVVLHHLGNPEGAAETLPGAEVFEADFTVPGSVEALAEAVLARPVDILVANAAIERRGPWEEIGDIAIQDHLAANFTSLLTLCQRLVPPMAARGWGRVVALSSVMAARPRAETLLYASLKSAQLTALRSIARDVAGQGVTLNAIAPGAIETERTADRYADPAFRAAVEAKIPARRPGSPEDCVAPVLMLCGEGGSYITGAEIPVDGGWTIGDAPGALPGQA